MKKITAYTVFRTAEGIRLSMVYSEISGDGVIIRDNCRKDRILMNEDAILSAEKLMDFAQKYLTSEGSEE